ncbi:hypothetical protein CRG98_001149 [Punica granatum]|uniref:Uncharacterized protein n=1 Tax=Punica granatum TaxID=22663 RepID=A0A2I0LCN4_PUNGR|nr:hypothetical protein CRG98_001149 [Punica granatum]
MGSSIKHHASTRLNKTGESNASIVNILRAQLFRGSFFGRSAPIRPKAHHPSPLSPVRLKQYTELGPHFVRPRAHHSAPLSPAQLKSYTELGLSFVRPNLLQLSPDAIRRLREEEGVYDLKDGEDDKASSSSQKPSLLVLLLLVLLLQLLCAQGGL